MRPGAEASLILCALSFGLIAAGAAWTRTTHSLASLLVAPLERRFLPVSIVDANAFTGVIALGGGAERIREACRLARQHRHLKVFVSGAGDEATVRAMLGAELADCRLELEDAARNTHGNALSSKAALGPEPGQRWLLVTSAAHMPRAIGAFRKAGFPVEPWPVHDAGPSAGPLLAVARHEWLGLLAYRLAGRTSELFPAP